MPTTVAYYGGPKANTTASEASPATFTIAGAGTYTYNSSDHAYYWSFPAPWAQTGRGPGFLASVAGNVESIPRLGLGEALMGDGVLWLAYFSSPVAVTIASLGISIGTTASITPTLCRLGLYAASDTDSVTLVARTANDTTIGDTTDTAITRALATTGGYPASYAIEANHRYALGVVMKAGTTAKMSVGTAVNPSMAPVLCRRKTGETDLATSYAVGALTAYASVPYLYAPGT